jgi:hypothetical protein
MGLGSYYAENLRVYITVKKHDYRTGRNRYKYGKHHTMKACMGHGHKATCILGPDIRQRCQLHSQATLLLTKEHPVSAEQEAYDTANFVANFSRLHCSATLDAIEILSSTHI